MKPTYTIKRLTFLLFVPLALATAGCADDPFVPAADDTNNGPPPVEVKYPVKMHITSVQILDYPPKNRSGDDYDWDPFSSGPRRPDIYIQLGNHLTNVVKNVAHPPSNVKVTFSGGYCRANVYKNGGQLWSYWMEMYDSDATSDDDHVDSVGLTPGQHYKRDNAATFSVILDGVYTKKALKISGQWIY